MQQLGTQMSDSTKKMGVDFVSTEITHCCRDRFPSERPQWDAFQKLALLNLTPHHLSHLKAT